MMCEMYETYLRGLPAAKALLEDLQKNDKVNMAFITEACNLHLPFALSFPARVREKFKPLKPTLKFRFIVSHSLYSLFSSFFQYLRSLIDCLCGFLDVALDPDSSEATELAYVIHELLLIANKYELRERLQINNNPDDTTAADNDDKNEGVNKETEISPSSDRSLTRSMISGLDELSQFSCSSTSFLEKDLQARESSFLQRMNETANTEVQNLQRRLSIPVHMKVRTILGK